jgi:hypothetical protein
MNVTETSAAARCASQFPCLLDAAENMLAYCVPACTALLGSGTSDLLHIEVLVVRNLCIRATHAYWCKSCQKQDRLNRSQTLFETSIANQTASHSSGLLRCTLIGGCCPDGLQNCSVQLKTVLVCLVHYSGRRASVGRQHEGAALGGGVRSGVNAAAVVSAAASLAAVDCLAYAALLARCCRLYGQRTPGLVLLGSTPKPKPCSLSRAAPG